MAIVSRTGVRRKRGGGAFFGSGGVSGGGASGGSGFRGESGDGSACGFFVGGEWLIPAVGMAAWTLIKQVGKLYERIKED